MAPMKRLRDYIIDGLLLMLPIAAVFVLLAYVIRALARVLGPIADRFPQFSWLGVATIDLVALVALLLALAAVGAFARSTPGRAISRKLEEVVFRKIPGFLIFKSIAAGFSTEEREKGVTPALIEFDDHVALGFVIEEAQTVDGKVTVFIPAAPTPVAGEIMLVKPEQVHPLNVPVGHAMRVVSRLGLGLQELTTGKNT